MQSDGSETRYRLERLSSSVCPDAAGGVQAKEGHIEEGSAAWEEMSANDRNRRTRAAAEKNMKLRSPSFFVSTTRLSLRNIPPSLDEKALKKVVVAAVRPTAALCLMYSRRDACNLFRLLSTPTRCVAGEGASDEGSASHQAGAASYLFELLCVQPEPLSSSHSEAFRPARFRRSRFCAKLARAPATAPPSPRASPLWSSRSTTMRCVLCGSSTTIQCPLVRFAVNSMIRECL